VKHDRDLAGERRRSRRDLFVKAAAGVGLLTAAAGGPIDVLMSTTWAQAPRQSDVEVVKFTQSIELAAVAAYRAARQTGLLDSPGTAALTLFAGHHQEHADSFDQMLGEQRVTDPNGQILSVYLAPIQGATDQTGILEVALKIEEAMASTYLFDLGQIGTDGAKLLASILPVESQHATALGTLLRKPAADYLPSVLKTDAALHPAG